MIAESLLEQYAQWRHTPPLELATNSGTRPQAIDGVECRPDGGLADFVARHQHQMRLDDAARMVESALPFLPALLREVFDATYIGGPLEVPRNDRDAAARMRVSVTKYQKLKFGLLCFLSGMNYRAMAVLDYTTTTRDTTKGRKAA